MAATKPVSSPAASAESQSIPSLGKAQIKLESSASGLRLAQRGFQEAALRLQSAEEAFLVAQATFNSAVQAVKSDTKVLPLAVQ